MLDSPEIEQARKNSDREVEYLPALKIRGEEVEPFIVIGIKQGRIRVFFNRHKLHRTLSRKNEICTTLDLHFVDTIQKLLDTLAQRETENEKILKDGGNQNGIQGHRRTGEGDSDSGQGGTSASNGRGFV